MIKEIKINHYVTSSNNYCKNSYSTNINKGLQARKMFDEGLSIKDDQIQEIHSVQNKYQDINP